MRTVQFDFGNGCFSKISNLEDDGKERRIRVPLGKSKEVYLIIKDMNKPTTGTDIVKAQSKFEKEELKNVEKVMEDIRKAFSKMMDEQFCDFPMKFGKFN